MKAENTAFEKGSAAKIGWRRFDIETRAPENGEGARHVESGGHEQTSFEEMRIPYRLRQAGIFESVPALCLEEQGILRHPHSLRSEAIERASGSRTSSQGRLPAEIRIQRTRPAR